MPSSDIPTSLWPRQDDPIARINLSDFGASTPIIADAAGSRLALFSMQQDAGPPDNLVYANSYSFINFFFVKHKYN